jgi:uncharacterized protein YecT (DUF1311 family)
MDGRLTNIYQGMISNIASHSGNYPNGFQVKDYFISSEQKWQIYRTAECTAEADTATGGTIQPEAQSLCLQKVTRERISYLYSISKDF